MGVLAFQVPETQRVVSCAGGLQNGLGGRSAASHGNAFFLAVLILNEMARPRKCSAKMLFLTSDQAHQHTCHEVSPFHKTGYLDMFAQGVQTLATHA